MVSKRTGPTGRAQPPGTSKRAPRATAGEAAAASLPLLRKHHRIGVPKALAALAGRLAEGFVSDRPASEQAIDLLDQAIGHLRLEGRPGPLAASDLEAVARLWCAGEDPA